MAESIESLGEAASEDENLPNIVVIAPHGDIVLDVLFETARETLKEARKATRPRPVERPSEVVSQPVLKSKVRVGYRVEVATLKKQSKYFNNLLGDTRFQEAKTIEAAFNVLSVQNIRSANLEPKELPWIRIEDDDEASKSAGREVSFAELLRILHKKETLKGRKNPPSLRELATLAILADRFACLAPVSAYLRSLRYRFPHANFKPSGDDGTPQSFVNEGAIRQKVLVAWLLDHPPVFLAGTRELVLFGSTRWSPYAEDDSTTKSAAWWDLPDDLEGELQLRREDVLNCIASVQHHFLQLYTSRDRQCKMGYDSSPACDSFQLGQMVKFLANKGLLSVADFSPARCGAGPDFAVMDVFQILTSLRQCPNYQINKFHTNCGLRSRFLHVLDFIEAMLLSHAAGIVRKDWLHDRPATTWAKEPKVDGIIPEESNFFSLTRSVGSHQRLPYEAAIAADTLARRMFRAPGWNWTPED